MHVPIKHLCREANTALIVNVSAHGLTLLLWRLVPLQTNSLECNGVSLQWTSARTPFPARFALGAGQHVFVQLGVVGALQDVLHLWEPPVPAGLSCHECVPLIAFSRLWLALKGTQKEAKEGKHV